MQKRIGHIHTANSSARQILTQHIGAKTILEEFGGMYST